MIENILPESVAVAERFEDDLTAVLFPEESAVIARASEARRREFTTARACAHRALARLGVPLIPVIPGARGCPQWPNGVVGSITHCDGYRAAAVGMSASVASLGVDAEVNEALPDDGMLDLIARDEERVRLGELASQLPDICWDRLLFSAKESVYKTWFPLARRWLGFESAQIDFDPVHGRFVARLLVPGPIVASESLTRLEGRWMARRGLLLTAVVLWAQNESGSRRNGGTRFARSGLPA